jgi:hypothetical protein
MKKLTDLRIPARLLDAGPMALRPFSFRIEGGSATIPCALSEWITSGGQDSLTIMTLQPDAGAGGGLAARHASRASRSWRRVTRRDVTRRYATLGA